ncbi:MAG: type III-A CRISPR-associated protein Cas10/Csm1, partial [Armatimonadetes bacterium]|nr:type III-A CRISPR-associated protein Cas10/Csm1 [Armatimonadota bacterium]
GGEEMLLVIGDISGIQDFIYRLQRRGEETQKGLAKRLRGRSFYLSALSRGFATYLAQLAGMSEANIVMAAGGNFQLLLPADAGLSLNQARKSINRWLLAEFRGRLALSLAWSRTTAEELQQPHAVAARIYDELSKAKLRKFTDLSGQDFLSTFRERITGECDSCGVAVTTDTQAPPSRDLSEADLRLCTNCWNARAIGDVLPDARFVAWHIGPLPDFAAPGNAIRSSTSGDIVRIELGRGLGENGQDVILAWPLERNCDDALSKGLLVDALCREDAQTPGVAWWPVAGHVAAVKDGEALRNFTEANKDRLPAGEDEELHEGDMLPFDWLSTLSRGDELIGVLRLDADHMGRVFGEGLQRLCAQAGLGTTDALACYMALSRYIDTFFGAWVDHVVQEEFREACKRASDFSGHIQAPLSKGEPERAFSSCFYTAYAGGDDLFIVGPWSETIHLAARLEADYSEYVCYNPDLTLSAGLLVSKPRVPIYMLAEAAGELERRSKEEGRNRITLFSTTLPWRSNGPGTTQSGAHTAPPQPSLQSGLELADIFARAVAGMLRRADDASGRAGGSPRSQARATKLPRGFLHLLLRLSARYAAREERAGAPPDYRYVPLLVWYLARTVAKVNLEIGDGSARKTLSGVLAEYLLASAAGGSRPWLREIKVPVSIALYLTRGGS